jgi:nicotinate-nucleotide pyrophosphorylase (carboxylating)
VNRSELSLPLITALVERALLEDLANGDITTDSIVPAEAQARAVVRARESVVVCGGPLVRAAFAAVDADVRFQAELAEGQRAEPGAAIWTISGRARSLLKAERTALNFAQRLSGIATQAAHYVAALTEGSNTRLVDTRKTTPLLRHVERYAVRTGGAHNHRDNLGSAVLIKDNHIASLGRELDTNAAGGSGASGRREILGVKAAIELARQNAPHSARIEVEVDTLSAFDAALEAGADIVLLDNFDDTQVAEALKRRSRRQSQALLEASGGITLERIRSLSALGVDVISVGALTHSVRAVDLGLDFEFDD